MPVQTNNIRALVFTALFAALFIVMNSLSIRLSFSPVPITLQTLGVLLAGLFLTPRNAFLSITTVILLTAIGLPLFNGKGGISYLLGHTGGFIIAFPFCALLISLAVRWALSNETFKRNKIVLFIALFIAFELFSSLLTYLPGIPWLMHVLNWNFAKAMAGGFYPFIIGDALKSALGAVLAISLTPYIAYIRSSTGSTRDTYTKTVSP
ncbi:biotin transporter BioY [Paenibacillus sp. YIM B09110]|uniref:biotin transporter BioY n=1 Tax=Paenibacillus sp. YIM B09110 TaxID=3126102 RepID=UPI00301C1471